MILAWLWAFNNDNLQQPRQQTATSSNNDKGETTLGLPLQQL